MHGITPLHVYQSAVALNSCHLILTAVRRALLNLDLELTLVAAAPPPIHSRRSFCSHAKLFQDPGAAI